MRVSSTAKCFHNSVKIHHILWLLLFNYVFLTRLYHLKVENVSFTTVSEATRLAYVGPRTQNILNIYSLMKGREGEKEKARERRKGRKKGGKKEVKETEWTGKRGRKGRLDEKIGYLWKRSLLSYPLALLVEFRILESIPRWRLDEEWWLVLLLSVIFLSYHLTNHDFGQSHSWSHLSDSWLWKILIQYSVK